jgi:hypothetical protein
MTVTAHPSPTPVAQPRIAGLVPARVVAGLPRGVEAAREALRLAPGQLKPTADGAWQSELDLPPGTWRVWPELGEAAWIAHAGTELPRVGAGVRAQALDLVEAVRRLHARGLWCLELRLLTRDGWGPNEPAADGLARLVGLDAAVFGLSGLFSGGEDGPARVELFRDGTVWAANWLDAERWLLTAAGIVDV